MAPTRPSDFDPLRPPQVAATEAWAARVRAGREQIERLQEVAGFTDFYAPMARRFRQDPRRTDDPALDVLRSLTQPGQTWLDIGAGGGRYSLPLALALSRVHAVDPSPSMLEVLQAGMDEHDIPNIDLTSGYWPFAGEGPEVDVALMAHVGYDIEGFGAFLDAAEAAASRCVVIMRVGAEGRSGHVLWPEIHGEPRIPYPMLPELLVLLVARGAVPEVTFAERVAWGSGSLDELVEASRRQLWLHRGSEKDRLLRALVEARASERDGQWALDWAPMQDGIVTWQSRRTAGESGHGRISGGRSIQAPSG